TTSGDCALAASIFPQLGLKTTGTSCCDDSTITCDSTGRITALDVSDNLFSGSIPSSIGSLAKLSTIDFSLNSFSGQIPDSIGSLSQLQTLDLAENLFSGKIPDSIGSLSQLERLSLADNAFTNSIPDTLGNLRKLTTLSLSSNQLTGSIPPSLGNLIKLQLLLLSMNHLNGTVPDSLSKLTGLQYAIDVTRNCLTGPPPASITNIKFDPQSDNCGASTSATVSSTATKTGSTSTTPTTSSSTTPTSTGSNSNSTIPIIAGATVGVVVILGLVAVLVVFWRRRSRSQGDLKKLQPATVVLPPTSEKSHEQIAILYPASSVQQTIPTPQQPQMPPSPISTPTYESTQLQQPLPAAGSINEKYRNSALFASYDQRPLSALYPAAASSVQDRGPEYVKAPLAKEDGYLLRQASSTSSSGSGSGPSGLAVSSLAIEARDISQFGWLLLWNHDQVMEWAREKNFDRDVIELFERHSVDGSLLNAFVKDPNVLKDDLGVTNFVTRAKITQAIELLQRTEAEMAPAPAPASDNKSVLNVASIAVSVAVLAVMIMVIAAIVTLHRRKKKRCLTTIGGLLHSFAKDPNVLKEDLGVTNFRTRARIIQAIELLLRTEAEMAVDRDILPPSYD
ncbi:hypothetical protein HDU76_005244, partial [Blyttiomyces sp. JEL0837]